MIEKPKRPKQPDIQERQPPRTLQELVSRYDLDNTKIYDFLDELVRQLNEREETVDTDISNINNNIDDINDDIVDINGDVTNLQAQITALSTKTTIKTKTVTGTLNNYGNISLGLSISSAKVLGVAGSGGQYLPFLSNTGVWNAYATGTSSTANTLNINKGTSVTVTVYYLEI